MSENITSLTFAGQAGFIIESNNGCRIGIDLYLSDCCYRYFGFKRLIPYLYNPLELNLDILVATHAHYDHFDPDSVPLIMSNSKTRLLCANDCSPEIERLNLDKSRIKYIAMGDVFQNCEFKIKAMPCDHGVDTPDAIGLLIEVDGKRIYIAGDTCFRKEIFESQELSNVDVMIMPINGAFGNLNESDSVKATGIIKPKIAIPCHYWNFAEHGGNPNVFAENMKTENPEIEYYLMRPGETMKI